MALTKSTIFSATYGTLYNLISEEVSDPKSRSKWIYSAFPDTKDRTLSSNYFPCIVIDKSETSVTTDTFGASGHLIADISVPINIWDTKASQVDTLSDSVYDAIITNKSTFIASGLTMPRIEANDSEVINFDTMRLHRRGMVFNGRYIHTV